MKSIVTLVLVGCLAATASPQSCRAKTSDDRVIAVVLGKNITVKDKDRVNGLIFGALLKKYAKDNNIAPTDQEIDAFVSRTEQMERRQQAEFETERKALMAALKDTKLGRRDRVDKEARLKTIDRLLKSTREAQERTKGLGERMDRIRRQTARHFVGSWKLNKALYEKYGGRVIFQQAGPEPVDAYRDFLREQERIGAFEIVDKAYEASFWRYFTNDAMHTFYSAEEGAKFINTPWWMMDEPPR